MLALIKNGVFIQQLSENSRLDLPNGTVIMATQNNWQMDDYSLHSIQDAAPVPEHKQIIGSSVEYVDGQWQLINQLADIVPPTPEELREQMPPLSRRQFWLGAHSLGVAKADVMAYAANDPALLIEVEESTEFHRTYESVVMLAPMLGITPEQLDDIWLWAAAA